MTKPPLWIATESLQNLMLAIGRGGDRTDPLYANFRNEVLSYADGARLAPDFVTTCRSGNEFWAYIKVKYSSYAERDKAVWDGFRPMFDFLEQTSASPASTTIAATLKKFDAAHVHAAWQKALERQATDPEAALTSARTLLESTCKHVLDGLSVAYNDTADLPDLYSLVAKNLNLSPSQHTDQIFKQILGGCHSVVQGIGSLRNRLGDAHGKGIVSYKPAARHAALAVNLSGAMSMYLVETYQAVKRGP